MRETADGSKSESSDNNRVQDVERDRSHYLYIRYVNMRASSADMLSTIGILIYFHTDKAPTTNAFVIEHRS